MHQTLILCKGLLPLNFFPTIIMQICKEIRQTSCTFIIHEAILHQQIRLRLIINIFGCCILIADPALLIES
ncbi:hypothetical protein CJU35_16410 [Pseudomonas aeruginosa]|nr:hypothetical protein CJU35_16410 [Pseudomonas aeruginosa]RPW83815.1 hypothetical protein IPC736_14355 [Pseudomonas aeruginosa]